MMRRISGHGASILPLAVLAGFFSCASEQNPVPHAKLTQEFDQEFSTLFREAQATGRGFELRGGLDVAGTRLAAYAFVPENHRGFVVWVHGYRASVEISAEPICRLNEAGWAVLAVDLQGHGESGGLTGSIQDFSDYSKALEQLLGAIAPIEPFAFIGHSMGAAAITGYLEEAKPTGARVVLIAPFIRLKGHFWLNLGAGIFEIFSDRLPGGVPRDWFRAYRRWSSEARRLEPLGMDCLVIVCGDDSVVDNRAAKRFASSVFPDAEFLLIPGVQHAGIQENDVDEHLWTAILGFLDR